MILQIEIKPPRVHHIPVRATEVALSKASYIDKPGDHATLVQPELWISFAGNTVIAIKKPKCKKGAEEDYLHPLSLSPPLPRFVQRGA